jgi:4-alpha-glucanotransferase
MPQSTPPEAGETGLETDGNVLRHLLDLETKAAALVDDAQAEADRRVAEGEKLSRARYDEVYSAEVAALEAAYTAEIAAVKADYQQQLDAYREGLKAMPSDQAAFSALAEQFLIREK